MLNTLFLLSGLVGAIGLGGISLNENVNNDNQIRLVNHKSVSYNDESYTITLNADELNNYVWDNLSFCFYDTFDSAYSGFYLSYSTIFIDKQISSPHTDVGEYGIFYAFSGSYPGQTDTYEINFNYNLNYVNYPNYITLLYNGERFNFDSDLDLIFNSTYYSTFKQAIELDIQANQPNNDYSSVLGDIVSLLTAGITSFAGGLGAGVSTLVGDIFLNAGHTGLSVFGYMVVIFAGISLAIGLSRWVMNFLTSLGAKK